MQHYISYIYLLSLLLATTCVGCRHHATQDRKAIPVQTRVIEPTTVHLTRSYVGTIEDGHQVRISTQQAGQVRSVAVRLGQHVQAGQLLVAIDSTQALNAAISARATLRQAQDAVTRMQQVYAAGGVTEQQRVELLTRLEQARSLEAMNRQTLTNCRICAPIDGVVAECLVREGQNLVPGEGVVTLVQKDGLEVVFSVPETELSAVHVGDTGLINIAAIHAESLPVVVHEKGVIASPVTHSYTVKASIPASSQYRLSDIAVGMVADVRLYSLGTTGVSVPASCIQLLQTGPVVWVVEGGCAVRRQVSVGAYANDEVIISSGLYSGDTLIISGYHKLWANAPISQ